MLTVLSHMSLLLVAAAPSADTTAARDVELAARDYRITVYEQLHSNRPLYDRYIAASAQVLDAWRRTEETQRYIAPTVEWFQSAQRSLDGGSIADLPPLPAWVENQSSHVHEVSSQVRPVNDGQLQLSESAPIREAAQSNLDVVEPPLTGKDIEANDADVQFPAFDPVPQVAAEETARSANNADSSGKDRQIVRSLQRALWRAVAD